MTYQSARMIGGESQTGNVTLTYCTALGGSPPCSAKAATGQYVNNVAPYIVLTMPSGSVPAGRQVTMPSIELKLKATGASGTAGQFRLTEYLNLTNATLIISVDATFDGYPTTGSNTAIVPPVAAPVILKTTTIS